MIVWARLSLTMDGSAAFSGLMKRPAMMDWKMITRTPARKNRTPAKRMMDMVSEFSIPNIV